MAADSFPAAADVRGAIVNIADWRPLGPSVLNDIIRCVEAVRCRVARRADLNPVALLIEYGQQIIAGSSPVADLPRQHSTLSTKHIGPISDEPTIPLADSPTAFGSATLGQLKSSLAKGQPFAFLFLSGAHLVSASTPAHRIDGLTPDESAAVAHTAIAVGYDDAQQAFMIIEASSEPTPYQPDDHGILLLSYAYVTHPLLSQDVWTIRTVPLAHSRGDLWR